MPELPEAETIARALEPEITGKVIERLELLHRRVHRRTSAGKLRAAVEKARIERVYRRGKYILFDLSGQRPTIAVHLRMSGQLILSREQMENPHLRAVFHLEDGTRINFIDTRTFGLIFPLDGDVPKGFRKLGVEPLSSDFTAAGLGRMLAGRSANLKSLLLRQDLIAGVGNIYASEVLFRARLHPARSGASLDMKELIRLHRSLRHILRKAIEGLGTTISDFRRPDGSTGEFANKLLVYGRAGEPCPNCPAQIERIVQNGRSTFFCPRCQHEPGGG